MRRRCAARCGRSLPAWADDYCGPCDDLRLALAAKREKTSTLSVTDIGAAYICTACGCAADGKTNCASCVERTRS